MSNVNAVSRKRSMDTAMLVKIGMLSAVSFVLMLFEISLPIFPFFLKMDLSDLPALIGAVSMGPVAGVMIELVKNILHLFKTSTAGVGEIANFLAGIAYIIPIGLFYKNRHTLKSFILGAVAGTICMTIAVCVFDYYILVPAFAKAFGTSIDEFVAVAHQITKSVVDLKTLIIFSFGPFNLLKGIVVAPIGYILCKVLKPIFYK